MWKLNIKSLQNLLLLGISLCSQSLCWTVCIKHTVSNLIYTYSCKNSLAEHFGSWHDHFNINKVRFSSKINVKINLFLMLWTTLIIKNLKDIQIFSLIKQKIARLYSSKNWKSWKFRLIKSREHLRSQCHILYQTVSQKIKTALGNWEIRLVLTEGGHHA